MVVAMDNALSRGTYYVEHNPMIMCSWGVSPSTPNNSIPLWVKFTNVPVCYWTRLGLSWLAGVTGVPLCADDLASKLQMLPFSKMCVNYKIEDPLPDNIEVDVFSF